MLFGVLGLKKTLSGFFVCILLTGALVSCGYNSSGSQYRVGSIKLRAFVSNPVHPNGAGGGAAALEIVDASRDLLSPSLVPLNVVPDAGMMAVSPKRDRTLIYSPANHALAIVSNAQQAVASTVSLLGPTESMFVWTDNTTAFVAVPNAAVAGQPAGVVQRIDISTASTTATIPIPGARFLVPSPSGNQILVISDSANAVTMLAPSLISGGNPLTTIQNAAGCSPNLDLLNPCTFDRPVWGVFSSDGTKAYVLNCGQECGGNSFSTSGCPLFFCGSVTVLDMATSTAGTPIPVPNAGATKGVLSGSTLYIAGTAPPVQSGQNTCSGAAPPTGATSCGELTAFDAGSMSVTGSAVITDGYHNRMQMGSNGQLFIGSQNCTNIKISGGEVRGCLTIANTSSGSISSVTAARDNGDVTGIEPIPNRHVVYVCEGGQLKIYDTTTDKLQTTQVSITGQAIDVKVVDF
jgi:hypothetical protein